ncbi:MAG: hypothetical protein ACTSPY_08695 [Candidatus Helarchaeota archaeon]
MSNNSLSKLREFHERLINIINKIGTPEIHPRDKDILKFCELIDDTKNFYFFDHDALKIGSKGKLIPPGFLLNFTCPITQQIFINGGPDFFPGLVKAIIHVGSTVDYLLPMISNATYKIKIDLNDPVLKSGSKGDYCSIIFTLSITNNDESKIFAIDHHEFFIKLF